MEYLEEKKLRFVYISTGDLGRQLAKQKTVIGKWIKGILDRGDFFPDWLAIHVWLSKLERELVNKDEIILFEGTPRKLAEAKMVDELMTHLDREPPVPIYLDIDDKEAVQKFQKKIPIRYPSYIINDFNGVKLSQSMGNEKGVLPFTVLLNPQNNIEKLYYGKVKILQLNQDVANALIQK